MAKHGVKFAVLIQDHCMEESMMELKAHDGGSKCAGIWFCDAFKETKCCHVASSDNITGNIVICQNMSSVIAIDVHDTHGFCSREIVYQFRGLL